MSDIPSRPWALATVVVVTLACVAVLAVVVVPAAQAQQSGAAEEEVEAAIRAELQARIAQLRDQLEAQMRQIEGLRSQDLERLQRELEEVAVNEARIRELAAQTARQAGAQQERAAVEYQRRSQEEVRRAMIAAEQSMQRARGVGTFRLHGGCESFGETVLDYTEDLALTDEQVGRIREAQRASRRDAIERNADIEVGEMDLEALYEAEDPDLAAIRSKLEELAMRRVDGEMAGLQLRRQVREVLTPTQLEQLEELRDDGVRVVISGAGSGAWRVGRIGC